MSSFLTKSVKGHEKWPTIMQWSMSLEEQVLSKLLKIKGVLGCPAFPFRMAWYLYISVAKALNRFEGG